MGGGATRLHSSLTQTLSSSSSVLHPPVDPNLDPAFYQVTPPLQVLTNTQLVQFIVMSLLKETNVLVLQEQKGSNPLELLRLCREALGDRPPRLHRKFTHLSDGGSAPSCPIRVMQWNMLAQGKSL